MSIINKMLQDLDRRNGRSGGERMAGDAIRSIKPESPWHLGRNIVLAIVGLGVASLAGAWWVQQRNHGSELRVAAHEVPAAPAVPAPAPAPSLAPAPVSVSVAVPVPANNPPLAAAPIALAPRVQEVTVAGLVATTKSPLATALPKAAPMAPPPLAAASSPGTPEKIEPPAPLPETVASPKATGGKTYTARQLSANLLAEAVMLDRQGHQEDAKVPLQRALAANPLDVQARQMLIQLMLDTSQVEKADALLTEGQRLLPDQSNFTLMLARLKVDRGDVSGAVRLLEAGRASARNDPEYHAFLAALLLRAQRYDDAAEHYLVALRSDPANAPWLVGVGVAFEGLGKPSDAAEAYRRADTATGLTAEMADFLSERLARLGR